MRAGIIIPFRDREDHLRMVTPALKQYGKIYVIEQLDYKPFNRGKLINIGFNEFKKEFDYFAAHDVDMLPEEVDYSYCEVPCHLAGRVQQFGYGMPYPEYFGGVAIFPNQAFEQINGFSNEYWGWGGEDDEVRKRLDEKNIPIQHRQCRYISLPHTRNVDPVLRRKNFEILKLPTNWCSGIDNCEYEIIYCEDFKNYTLLQVNI